MDIWHGYLHRSLYFGLVICLLAPSSTLTCPTQCICEEYEELGKVKVTCSSLPKTTLPKNSAILNLHSNKISTLNDLDLSLVPHGIKVLNLSNTDITNIDQILFEHLPNLRVLVLRNNNISDISDGSFQKAKQLSHLDLSLNRINAIQAATFEGLVNLKVLNLSYNLISNVENATFLHLPNLQTLDMRFNSYLSVSNSSFTGMPILEKCYLQGCDLQLTDLQALSNLPNLHYLDLSHSYIPQLQESTFPKLPNLQHLTLNNCSIVNISALSRSMPSLVTLSLDYNQMKEIRDHTFDQLTSLEELSIQYMPNLNYIYRRTLRNLSSLMSVYISHNRQLSFVHSQLFLHQHNLSYLDLSFNNLSHLQFNSLKGFKNLTINLQGNKLICDCDLDWIIHILQQEVATNIKFQSQDLLQCKLQHNDTQTIFVLQDLLADDIFCDNVSISTTSKRNEYIKVGSNARLVCETAGNPAPSLTWITPRNQYFFYRNSHADALREHPSTKAVQEEGTYHKDHHWHDSSSYQSDLYGHSDRIVVLQDGSLYIDYLLRSDTGAYTCIVQNSRSKVKTMLTLHIDCLITEVKIMSLFIGLACAASFFMLNLIYAFVSALARRCVNQRRRDAILKLLDNLEQYKSSQMTKLRDNYNTQVGQVRDKYHQRLERLRGNYTSQMSKIRQGASSLKEGASNKVDTLRGNYKNVRENYNNQLGKLRYYSSHQLEQIRERYSNQVLKIRDYGSLQLGRFHHKYKLQQQHVMKLLEMMNMDNCRTVFETECVRAESMILETNLAEPDVASIPSPVDSVSVAESEYLTASSDSEEGLECSDSDYKGCVQVILNTSSCQMEETPTVATPTGENKGEVTLTQNIETHSKEEVTLTQNIETCSVNERTDDSSDFSVSINDGNDESLENIYHGNESIV